LKIPKINLKFLKWTFVLLVLIYFLAGFILAMLDETCLPKHLEYTTRTDYYFRIVRWIPRNTTSRCLVEPPQMIFGSKDHRRSKSGRGIVGPSPIGERGQWQMSAVQVRKGWPFYFFYFAATTEAGMHYRIGVRWDDVDDHYIIFSIARRNFTNEVAKK
jgi:hypothetical protein